MSAATFSWRGEIAARWTAAPDRCEGCGTTVGLHLNRDPQADAHGASWCDECDPMPPEIVEVARTEASESRCPCCGTARRPYERSPEGRAWFVAVCDCEDE